MGKLTHTVKGPIASFRSADKANIESLKLHFLPKQEGSGDPSPTNVRPITGWTGCNLNKAKKNLFKFETGRTRQEYLSSGYLRAIYHTGIISDGRKISISGSPKNPEELSNNMIHIGRCNKDDGLIYTVHTFISSSGSLENVTVQIPAGDELTFDGTGDSIWSVETRNLPRYNIQIEIADSPSTFTPYEGSTLPVSWSSHGVEYGGYVDLVKGEIWATHYHSEIDTVKQYTYEQGYFWYITAGELGIPAIESENAGLMAERLKPVSGLGYSNPENQISFYANGIIRWKENGTMSLSEYQEYLSNNPISIAYKLLTPVLVATFDPTELQTFLDYNNFWSDMNDDTEVEYEFADRLSERKLIMDTPHVESVQGSVASFDTDIKAPIVELKTHFTPVQEGTGDPSPTNVRPITGWTGLYLNKTGGKCIKRIFFKAHDK